MTKTGEIRSLTGLRGVAACLVMVFHLSHGTIENDFIRTFVSHGYLAVDMFLILSGFVLALTYYPRLQRDDFSYLDFLCHRLIRIWPVYAALTLAYATIMLAKGVQPDAWFGFTLFANITMIHSWAVSPPIIGPGWSVSAEWAACLLFPVLASAAIASSWRATTATLLVAFATLIALAALPWQWVGFAPKIDPLDIHDWTTLAPVVRCLADFVLGLIAYKVYACLPGALGAVQHTGTGITVACCMLAGMFLHGVDLLLVLMFFLFILHLTSDRGPIAAFLHWKPVYNLGLWSYAIYLVHYRTEAIWYYLSSKLEESLPGWGHAAATTILCVSSVAVAIPIHLLFEKPVQRYLRRHYDRPRRPSKRPDFGLP